MNIIEAREILSEVIEIVFSNKYPEYKEDALIELLKPYKGEWINAKQRFWKKSTGISSKIF